MQKVSFWNAKRMKLYEIIARIIAISTLQYKYSSIKMPLKQYKNRNEMFANKKKLLNLLQN